MCMCVCVNMYMCFCMRVRTRQNAGLVRAGRFYGKFSHEFEVLLRASHKQIKDERGEGGTLRFRYM